MLPVWLIPSLVSAGVGLLASKGQADANRANERMADKQMDFQERMSSTSAQRSVEDYTKAGLNPALAYDRPASAPAGAMSRAESSLEKGVSTALQARSLAQQLENMRTQNEVMKSQNAADLSLKKSQEMRNLQEGATAVVQGDLLSSQRRQIDQISGFRTIDQPFETRRKAALALLEEYGLAGARNVSGFENRLGQWSPGLKFFLNGAGSAARTVSGLGITR